MHFMLNNFLSKIVPFMSFKKVLPNRPMRIAYWITKATNIHSEYIQLITFSLQLLHERASILLYIYIVGPPLWSSGQSFWLQIQRSRVRFPALPDLLCISGSGTGSTQPREVN